MVLKVDIESTSELAKLAKLRIAVAKILKLNPAVLRLLDVEEGCVVVTFLIPTPVAEIIFNKHSNLSIEQEEEFQALKILWLECNDQTFSFCGFHRNQTEEVKAPGFTTESCHSAKLQVAENLQYTSLHQKQVDNGFKTKGVKFADLFHHDHRYGILLGFKLSA